MKKNELNEATYLATDVEAQSRYRISRGTLIKLAAEADAVVKFGGCVRFDLQKLDKHINEQK